MRHLALSAGRHGEQHVVPPGGRAYGHRRGRHRAAWTDRQDPVRRDVQGERDRAEPDDAGARSRAPRTDQSVAVE